MSAKPKPRQKRPNGTIQALAKALDVSVRHAHTLTKSGCPTDPTEAIEWRRAQAGEGDHNSAELLRRARLRLVNAQELRVRLENDVRAGKLIETAQVDAEATHIGAAMKGALLSLEASLPGALLGLRGHGDIRQVLHLHFIEIMRQLSRGGFFDAPGVKDAILAIYPDYKERPGPDDGK